MVESERMCLIRCEILKGLLDGLGCVGEDFFDDGRRLRERIVRARIHVTRLEKRATSNEIKCIRRVQTY